MIARELLVMIKVRILMSLEKFDSLDTRRLGSPRHLNDGRSSFRGTDICFVHLFHDIHGDKSLHTFVKHSVFYIPIHSVMILIRQK